LVYADTIDVVSYKAIKDIKRLDKINRKTLSDQMERRKHL
jgi:hypothetical protein